MTTKNVLSLLAASTLLVSCGATQFAITDSGESLTALTKVTDNEEPCVSPYGGDNGKDLFFAACESRNYYNIFKKENPFSSAMSQKTSGKNFNLSPAYNAVADKIAFRCQLEGASTSDIYMMNNNQGKALTQITESMNAFEDNPCFSPDGKFLVYDKTVSTYYRQVTPGSLLFGMGAANLLVVQNSEIWMRNLSTGESILLGNGSQPAFSPDGQSLVFTKYSSDARSCSIWTMSTDGSNQVQVTDAKKGYAFHPRFSPDGKRIVFDASRKDKKDSDIYIIDVDGNNLIQVTANKSYDGQPYWTTDGYIYFVSDRGGRVGNRQIWRFKL
ncbi:MAG: PD40 domain-containing protein [Bacteroidaceae bacterium]|nr:PD40 domain-containing protein [Bacteroidaceae bacterium]